MLSFALGDPAPFVAAAHEAGVHICAMVTTVEEAVRVVDGGVDLVVAQGAEAGGHKVRLSTSRATGTARSSARSPSSRRSSTPWPPL